MLRKPLIRHIAQTPYGMQVHPTEPMQYSTSDKELKQEGEDAGYDVHITHHAFRRWTANEANRYPPSPKSQEGQPNVYS
jgi:tRNA(Leu) C34 or U34 (ribose-2'-O)-methylase TrmL